MLRPRVVTALDPNGGGSDAMSAPAWLPAIDTSCSERISRALPSILIETSSALRSAAGVPSPRTAAKLMVSRGAARSAGCCATCCPDASCSALATMSAAVPARGRQTGWRVMRARIIPIDLLRARAYGFRNPVLVQGGGALTTRSLLRVSALAALLLGLTGASAFAQGTNSSISGSVIDSAGGAIPGAAVLVKNQSGVSFEAVSNGEGLFNVPGVPPGVYTVSVSLSGFKTAVVKDVRVAPGTPATIKATLEVGQLSETVNVAASSELINTQTATVSSTLNSDQLLRMPTPTRNALNAVTFLPGINTATTNRESRINGLPESFVSITLDGVSNNDNFLRSSDSFFASVTPRQDAVEAVNVTTAVQGAQTGGSGAVSINFSTRSGTNVFTGSGYEYWRDPSLNTNYWFNERNGLPKNEVKLNQYGVRLGGPIVIPGLYDGHNKAFFFANYEQVRFPNSFTRTRTVLNPRALQGNFRYTVGGAVREVNVIDLARANGQIA